MIVTSVNIQLHIHKWNHTITTSAQYSFQNLSFFTYILFSNFYAKQKVSHFLLSWFTLFVEIAHFSEWAVFIWAAALAIGTAQHAPEKNVNIYVDRLWKLVHFMHCIFWASALKVYLLLSYLSCSTLFIPSNPLPFTFPGVSLYPGPHPCPRLVENKSDNSY